MIPGRGCPLSYRYDAARAFSRPELQVDTLWVAGGVYGNPFALQRLLELYDAEPGSKALVFNGDFHWFDVDDFLRINESVLQHVALRGNVETEISAPAQDAGCGCGYPEWVDDGTVARSNRILERLRAAARRHPRDVELLARLPMTRLAEVSGVRVAIVHGDAESLAGWNFSQERLATSEGMARAVRAFDAARASVFASSHTCLPVLQRFPGERLIVNNGATGMPNFAGTPFGLATRISHRPGKALYAAKSGRLRVEAVAVDYDAAAWQRRFLEQWPEGSDAHNSYYARIKNGPRYAVESALRRQALAAA
jgi:hypothetical protein